MDALGKKRRKRLLRVASKVLVSNFQDSGPRLTKTEHCETPHTCTRRVDEDKPVSSDEKQDATEGHEGVAFVPVRDPIKPVAEEPAPEELCTALCGSPVILFSQASRRTLRIRWLGQRHTPRLCKAASRWSRTAASAQRPRRNANVSPALRSEKRPPVAQRSGRSATKDTNNHGLPTPRQWRTAAARALEEAGGPLAPFLLCRIRQESLLRRQKPFHPQTQDEAAVAPQP